MLASSLAKGIRPWHVILAICALAALVAAGVLLDRRPVEKTERRSSQQVTRTEVAAKSAATSDTRQRIDTTGFAYDAGSSRSAALLRRQRNTRTVRKRTTTRFDPATGAPLYRTEEELSMDDARGSEAVRHDESQAQHQAQEATSIQSAQASATQTQTSTVNETSASSTSESRTVTGSSNSRIGIAVTTSRRPALTFDAARLGRLGLTGLVEVDPAKPEISALGAGVTVGIAQDSRYFAGVYGQYKLPQKQPGVAGCIGMRF